MAKKAEEENELDSEACGRFDYEGLDRVLHEKARLGLMTCLAGSPEGLSFGELKALCNLTDGNLNRHLKQLSDAKLVRTKRIGRQTNVSLTVTGRKRFIAYLAELQRVIVDAETQMKASPSGTQAPGLRPAN